MAKYTYDEVESRVEFSRKMFHQIEEKLDDFLNYVPFDSGHLEVYSLKLVTIILEVGPELINSFELAVCESDFGIRKFYGEANKDREDLLKREKELRARKKSLTFKDYYCFLVKHEIPSLSTATIQLRESKAYMMPFEQEIPIWWDSCYNLLRHDKYSNLKNATLRNTLKATAALFWLIENNSKPFPFDRPFPSKLFLTNEDLGLLISYKKI